MRNKKERTVRAADWFLFLGGRCVGFEKGRVGCRRIFALAMLVTILPMLAACPAGLQQHLYADYLPVPLANKNATTPISTGDSFSSLVNALVSAGYLDGRCFANSPPQMADGASGADAVSAPGAASTPGATGKNTTNTLDCVQQRNYIVAMLVAKSNDACQAHKATMFGNEASWNVTLGTLTNIFTGTATVIGGPVGKSIFSALGLFSNAERSLVNEEVYQNLLVPAIGQKIDETRSSKLSDINSKVKASKDMSTYPMYQAISDVMEYHNDCSFMLGLQLALKEGTGGGVASQYMALKRAEQSINSDIDLRKSEIRNANPSVKDLPSLTNLYGNDTLLNGLVSRLGNVEDQLKVIETLPSSKPTGS